MALNLYRRHGSRCAGGRALHNMTYEADELRRGWKKCSCPIYASGTLAGRFRRKNTERTSWDEAKSVVSEWTAVGTWESTPIGIRVHLSDSRNVTPPEPARITIVHAIALFLDEHSESSAPNTQRKYAFITRRLKTFSDEKGYIQVSQWGPMDVREFRHSWQVGQLTSAKYMSIVKAFFEFCLSNEWITRNPARLVRNARGRVGDDPRTRERIPFSDEELKRMFDACEESYGKQPIRWSRKVHHRPADIGETVNYRYKWTGQDLADFISVSVYTGLRISDVSTFRIDRLKSTGECHIRTTKSGRKVYTWIPEWLQERIRARAEQVGPLIFGEHSTTDMNVITDIWRRKLNRLWKLCGPWSEKPTPHRFRHTFARILLQRPNVTVRDVAELLGNTEEMVRKHYAAWVSERQERLTSVLQEAFSEKPKPKVIVLSGRT